jgi:hypothetical protein
MHRLSSDMLPAMRRALLFGVSLIAGGVIVVALPDSGQRLFSLSGRHGPSLVDAIGVAFLLAGWVVVVVAVVRRGERVARRAGVWGVTAAVIVAALGLALIGWGVVGDHGPWWVAGVALVVLPQIWAIVLAR